MICGSGGSKSRLAKAAGAEPAGQMRDEKLLVEMSKGARHCGAKHISKSKCTKHTSSGPLLTLEMSKKCTPLWREAPFQVKMHKTHQLRTTFGTWDVEKVHAVVARRTFPSQNVQNTPLSDHFWKLRCRKSARRFGEKHISKWKCTKHTMYGPLLEVQMSKKSARRCGAKHISKSKCTKHTMYGPFLLVEMSKKCTPLWCEAHFQVKMYKTHHCRTTFGSWDVEKVHAGWREAHFEVKMYKTHHVRTTFGGSDVEKSARRCGAKHISKSKCTKHTMYGPFLEVQKSFRVAGARDCGPCQKWAKREGFVAFSTTTTTTLHYTPIHYTTLHYILQHYTPLHYTALNYTQLHNTTLHYTTLHYTTLHHITLHYTTFHYITLHYTPLHYITLHYTTLHYTTLHLHLQLHYTTLNYTTLHYTTLHYIPRHSTTLHYTTLHYTEWHCTTDRQVDR